ncbi:MAG TPA: PH domain-containing protein [Stellaceae bacterium]|nr:PH domain-containing protein [Stellaceae bacterium]
MNYVRRVLQPGETVIHIARIHPVIFLPAALWLVLAVILLIAALTATGDLRIGGEALALFCLLLAAGSALPALLRRISTELAVTDRRVIYKSGILARHTLEMNRSKVESVDVDQSVLGRFIGFGTIIVRGTGGSLEPIRMISDPLTFRSHITAS